MARKHTYQITTYPGKLVIATTTEGTKEGFFETHITKLGQLFIEEMNKLLDNMGTPSFKNTFLVLRNNRLARLVVSMPLGQTLFYELDPLKVFKFLPHIESTQILGERAALKRAQLDARGAKLKNKLKRRRADK